MATIAKKVMSVTGQGILTFHQKRRIKIPTKKQPSERHHLKIDPDFWEYDKQVAIKVAAVKAKLALDKKLEIERKAKAFKNVDNWFNNATSIAS